MFNWLLLLIAYIPFQIALNPWPGIDLASGRVFILWLFGIWLIIAFFKKQLNISLNFQTVVLLSFLLISGFSILMSENYLWGLRKFLFFLSVFPLYFLVVFLVDDYKKAKRITWALIGGGGAIALIGLVQFLAQFAFGLERVYGFWAFNIVPVFSGFNLGALILAYPSWLVNISGKTIMRAISLFSDPHMFSFYIGLILPLLVVLLNNFVKELDNMPFGTLAERAGMMPSEAASERSPRVNFPRWGKFTFPEGILSSSNKVVLLLVIYFLLFIGLLLSFTRGAYLAIVITFIVLAWLFWRYLYSKKTAILLLLSVLVFIVPKTPISARFYSIFDFKEGSNVGRLEMWQEAGRLGIENPWWGLGLGNYSLAVDPSFGYRNPMNAHNLYLDIFSEIGVFALLIWGVLILGTILGLFKLARSVAKTDMKDREIAVGLIGSLVYFSAHSFFETAIYSPVILAVLMVILGLCSKILSRSESI